MTTNKKIWEYYGDNDPYFGVNTVAEMRSDILDQANLDQLFASGDEYLDTIWREIEQHFGGEFRPQRSLDFGCGVGRLTIPIAKRSGEAVGVDISSGMLEIASENARNADIDNITFVQGDDSLSRVTGTFNFVHSFIVFQHIDPQTGGRLFERMVDMLEDDGIGMLHIQYASSDATAAEKFRFAIYRDIPFIYSLRNLVLRKRREPLIPMYSYDLNRLMLILQKADCHEVQIRFSKHGVDGVMIFFRKRKGKIY